MAKRKRRQRADDGERRPAKVSKSVHAAGGETGRCHRIAHPILEKYYEEVLTLRQYFLSKAPSLSKRRKRLLRLLQPKHHAEGGLAHDFNDTYELLDKILVGTQHNEEIRNDDGREDELQHFTQKTTSTAGTAPQQAAVSLGHLVEFVISLLFKKHDQPRHILCLGLTRTSSFYDTIPGLKSVYPNEHVETLNGHAWSNLLALLGRTGDRVVADLLLDCGIFVPLQDVQHGYYQLSGWPMHALKIMKQNAGEKAGVEQGQKHIKTAATCRSAVDIRFVRRRIFYARAAVNKKGAAALGMRHIHVLNRFPNSVGRAHAIHVMKYIFPRQFGLHNVFTSETDRSQINHQFRDYTLREEEIEASGTATQATLPKRLRGRAFDLINKLQILHRRCAYKQLLDHYCPAPPDFAAARSAESQGVYTGRQVESAPLATPATQVASFCRAVLTRVIPLQLLGEGKTAKLNHHVMMRNVGVFIRAGKYEVLTLAAVMTGVKIKEIEWLQPLNSRPGNNMSLSDLRKRQELLSEFFYYVFDSFLIPLIRSNFYVTESSENRSQLLYFRHDVWRYLSEPALTVLKSSMFEKMPKRIAIGYLGVRSIGCGKIRLVPKERGMRPITNLARWQHVVIDGVMVSKKPVNKVLKPAFTVLKSEKIRQPHRLGASLFSVAEIFPKLRAFKHSLLQRGQSNKKLYFVKVDVKKAYDSLPHAELIHFVRGLLSAEEYNLLPFAAIQPPEIQGHAQSHSSFTKPWIDWDQQSITVGATTNLTQVVGERSLRSRPYTTFVDEVVPKQWEKNTILQMLENHITRSIIQFGKKYYRQKQGIAQGSILSTLLCNFFYADFERQHLGFLTSSDCALLRYVDDFLLLTVDKSHAEKFLQVMYEGNPSYGISIKLQKSLVNFDAHINGNVVPRLDGTRRFPYAGMLVDTDSLDISKATTHSDCEKLNNTVEYHRLPGRTFRLKMLSELKRKFHTILLDTSYNTIATVLNNILEIMLNVAAKCFQYAQSLSARQATSPSILIGIVRDLSALAFAKMKSKRHIVRHTHYHCAVGRATVTWLTTTAFLAIFGPKQTKYGELVEWLQKEENTFKPRSKGERNLLATIVRGRTDTLNKRTQIEQIGTKNG